MATDRIVIRGARQHNLKNVDVTLPRNQLTVITGPSGSGKSTLAFDTLYAEGQRRYVESLSTYARQFLERMQKPEVDLIEGLSPAIAIEQKTAAHNPRSTVGTVTEIYDYLRLLYARVGLAHCPQCGRPIASRTIDQIVDEVMALPDGSRVVIMAPITSDQKCGHEKALTRLKKEGFARVRVDGEMRDLDALGPLDPRRAHRIEVVVDRVVIKHTVRNRLTDSLELALAQGSGVAMAEVPGGESIQFSEKAACLHCAVAYPELTPASFSFNSPQGACPRCGGLGSTTEFSRSLIVPDRTRSLRQGAVDCWARRNSAHFMEILEALSAHYGLSTHTPFAELPQAFQEVVFDGSGAEVISFYFDRGASRIHYRKAFEGVIPFLARRYRQTESDALREDIKRYMEVQTCPACGGGRLNPASRTVRIQGMSLPELCALSVSKARRFCMELDFQGRRQPVARLILAEIVDRLGFLVEVGLPYLALERPAQSLSGGESQRIRLATQIGSKLSGVLYVLDEPSVGLHQQDNRRLIDALARLRDLGNTVLVVEHDADTIRAADYVVDMGPGAGVNGGRVIFAGTPRALLEDAASLTGNYLSGRMRIEVPERRRPHAGPKLVLEGAAKNNLKAITVGFPLGCLIGVTGVSGSGKSSLVFDTLVPAVRQRLGASAEPLAHCRGLSGSEPIDKVITIDQSPIGRTPRSNPGTYTGLFGAIRELFARTPDARMRGYKAGRFSFNLKGGRCEACQGDGTLQIEMHFLPDVYVACDVCRGSRYNRETLEVRYKGKTIADVLEMTVAQGLSFFGRISGIRDALQTLSDVGLGYVRLGQAATTLSGGEAQRVKLSRELAKKATGRTLYLLDEPTTGLHADDIRRLLQVLNRLVDAGNTVIVIEHNLDVIKTADYVIDLGPGGGEDGGELVGSGTPEQIAANRRSATGRFLQQVLTRPQPEHGMQRGQPSRKKP
jgi:excinuclease ABC subunit A